MGRTLVHGIGKVCEKGEYGAKIGVRWVDEMGKTAKGSFSKLKDLSTKEEKVLSRPLAEQRKADAFAKKFGDVTFKNEAGKEQTRFSYSEGKVFDHKSGMSFLPKQFPAKLAEARVTMANETLKTAQEAQKAAQKAAKAAGQQKGFFSKSFDWMEKHHKIVAPVVWTGMGWGALQVGRASEHGLIGIVGEGLGGSAGVKDSLGEGLLGKKGYSDLCDGLSSAADEVKGAYKGAKSAVLGVGDEAVGLYQDGKQMVGNIFTGNGMVANGNGGYYDPTTESYPSMAQMQMTNQQGGGLMNGLMNAMNNAVGQVSGGNISKLNIAGLLLSAYMMFGRFGWLGKAASLMLGGMTLHNINGRQAAVQMQQGQQQIQQQARESTQQYPLQTAEFQSSDDENNVVRVRRM